MVEVWEMIAACDLVMDDHDLDEEMKQWIIKTSIRKLDFDESWWAMNNPNDESFESDGYEEYLLTEKQSALFLLRFK